jgi:tripartite-type tricarboxylate transporter receptor subunit TctC
MNIFGIRAALRGAALSSRFVTAAFALAAAPAFAQAPFPSKPILLSVGFAPGGGTDITARLLARKLAEQLGQPVNVENKPGAMAYGTSGIGSTGHLSGALFETFAKVDLTHVPYKGGGPAMADLLGNQVQSVFASAPSAVPHIKSGKIRALAVTSLKRSDTLPDVPAIAETFAGYDVNNWYAFVAPPKMPRDIAERWNREIVKALNDPKVREQIREHGMDSLPSTEKELAERIEREYVLWEKIVKRAGITAE